MGRGGVGGWNDKRRRKRRRFMSSISSEGAMITMSGQAPGRGGWVGGGWVNKHAVKQVDSNKKIRKGGEEEREGCVCV